MKNNDKNFSEISSLSDERLKALINEIADTLGADAGKAAMLTNDLDAVRSTISGISDADAKRLIDRAGREKASRIYDAIKRSRE